MKQFTRFLMLAVALLASATAWGRISPGERVTDLSSLKTGDRIFVQGKWFTANEELAESHWLSTYWPAEKADSVVVAVAETVGSQAAFELEETGNTYNMKFDDGTTEELKGFYVKSVSSGLYLNKGASASVTYEARLYLTSEKQTEWYISKAVTMGTNESGDKVNTAPENASFFFCMADDGQMLALNNNYTEKGAYSERVAYFNNPTVWHEINYASEDDQSFEAVLLDIDELYSLSYNQYGNIVQGTNPGFCIPAYAEALDAAMANSQDDSQLATIEAAKECYNNLLNAYIGVRDHGMVPVSNGYYWFINCQSEWDGLSEGGTQVSLKTENGNEIWWCKLDTTKAEFVWKITDKGDGTFEMKNLATSQVVDNGSNSKGSVYTIEGESKTNVKFVPLAATQGSFGIYVNNTIDDATEDYFYIHCLSHGNVDVKTGSLACLWLSRPQEYSGWYMIRIPDETVKKLTPEDEEVKKQKEWKVLKDSLQNLNSEISTLLKNSIDVDSTAAVDVTPTLAAEKESNFESFFSNAGMSVEHGFSYGNDGSGFLGLIDGDPSTFFHTTYGTQPSWSNYTDVGVGYGYQTTKHNLGCKMTQAVNNVFFIWQNRSTYSDAPKKFDLEASNDGENWTPIFYDYNLYDIPGNGGIMNIGPINLGGNYQYIRFSTAGCSRGTFFNLAAWQILTNVTYTKGSALDAVPAETLNSLLAEISNSNYLINMSSANDNGALKQQITNLTNAYKNFNSAFVDPAELKAAVSNAKTTLSDFVISENTVGTYAMTADTTALHNSLAEAEAKLAAGGYTADEVASLSKTLNDQIAELANHIIKPDPNKWYQMQFASEEEFNEYNFSSDGEPLIDRVVCVTQGYDDETEGPKLYDSAEDVVYGKVWLQSVASEDAWNVPELSYFRFIAIGDSGYVLQNKATGLFIPNLGRSVNINLSINPGVFNIKSLGHGFVTFTSQSMVDGAANDNNFHFGNPGSQYYLVGYPGGMATKSAFHVVTIEEDDQTIGNANMTGVRSFVATEDLTFYECDAYVTLGRCSLDGGNTYIAMKRVENVEAGTPVIVMPIDAETPYMVVTGTSFISEPLATVGVKGTFVSKKIANKFASLKTDDEGTPYWQPSSTTGLSSTAYGIYLDMTEFISLPQVEEDDADLLVLIKGYDPVVSVDKINTDVVGKHTIYTLDGVRVYAQPNDLSKGIYIIDGKKVLVP